MVGAKNKILFWLDQPSFFSQCAITFPLTHLINKFIFRKIRISNNLSIFATMKINNQKWGFYSTRFCVLTVFASIPNHHDSTYCETSRGRRPDLPEASPPESQNAWSVFESGPKVRRSHPRPMAVRKGRASRSAFLQLQPQRPPRILLVRRVRLWPLPCPLQRIVDKTEWKMRNGYTSVESTVLKYAQKRKIVHANLVGEYIVQSPAPWSFLREKNLTHFESLTASNKSHTDQLQTTLELI